MRRDGVLGDTEDAGGVADTAAVEGHVHDGLPDPRLVDAVGVGKLKRAPAILAAAAGVSALLAVPDDVDAVAMLAMNFFKYHGFQMF